MTKMASVVYIWCASIRHHNLTVCYYMLPYYCCSFCSTWATITAGGIRVQSGGAAELGTETEATLEAVWHKATPRLHHLGSWIQGKSIHLSICGNILRTYTYFISGTIGKILHKHGTYKIVGTFYRRSRTCGLNHGSHRLSRSRRQRLWHQTSE